ncbi:UDP-glucose/GDP-mannose dehydrogenase family protein [Gammaproteobacteria bacterium]|nr:UDP-glucose/GDP-mannose dehydrogenase family protein [Gammaproteobacteria bacterium]
MKITVIGCGYVGLVTATCFASLGHEVICLDTDKYIVRKLQQGVIPFFEPGLQERVQTSLKNKSLVFTTSYAKAAKNNILFLCVGTPDKNGQADLSYIHQACNSLLQHLQQQSFLFIKSTVPLGTCKALELYFAKNKNKNSTDTIVASNPEFLKEGSAINDFLKPDRVIIGSKNKEVQSIAKKIYGPLNLSKKRLLFMGRESAELTKYAANAFLATKISFINEISWIAEDVGANIADIQRGIGSDPRIGDHFLDAGLGYGGSCFPKDINSIINFQQAHNYSGYLISATKQVNEKQLELFFNKIQTYFINSSASVELALWGLSFKPGTDDIRDSIAIKLIKKLSPLFANINVYDPLALKNARIELSAYKNINFCTSKCHSIKPTTSALILCTEWEEFYELKTDDLKNIEAIFDGRNIFSPTQFKSVDIDYFGIGV